MSGDVDEGPLLISRNTLGSGEARDSKSQVQMGCGRNGGGLRKSCCGKTRENAKLAIAKFLQMPKGPGWPEGPEAGGSGGRENWDEP